MKKHSRRGCIEGGTFGCDGQTMWVNNGCRGTFQCNSESLLCESWDLGFVECDCGAPAAVGIHSGRGANYLCMHGSPQQPAGATAANNDGSLLYGVQSRDTGELDRNHNLDMACVVCQRPTAQQIYVQWGRSSSCSNGHQTEYSGLVMSTRYDEGKSEYICVDPDRAPHRWSDSSDQPTGRIYTVEMRRGAAAEPLYPDGVEVGCSVCSVSQGDGSVFERWGSQTCPEGSELLYEGFMASAPQDHSGSGANFLYMLMGR